MAADQQSLFLIMFAINLAVAVFVLMALYAAQKWAHQTYKEVKRIADALEPELRDLRKRRVTGERNSKADGATTGARDAFTN